jgi:hypothetical protein
MMVGVALLGMMLFSAGAVVFANDRDNGTGRPEHCERRLVGKTFQCEAIDQEGSKGTVIGTFTAPGTLGDFDLTIVEPNGDSFHYGCSCRAGGTFRDPDFDQDPAEFICANAEVAGEAVVGQVTRSGKISAESVQVGEEADAIGLSSLFRCRRQS